MLPAAPPQGAFQEGWLSQADRALQASTVRLTQPADVLKRTAGNYGCTVDGWRCMIRSRFQASSLVAYQGGPGCRAPRGVAVRLWLGSCRLRLPIGEHDSPSSVRDGCCRQGISNMML